MMEEHPLLYHYHPANTECATYYMTSLLLKLQYWHLTRLELPNSAVKSMMKEQPLLHQHQ